MQDVENEIRDLIRAKKVTTTIGIRREISRMANSEHIAIIKEGKGIWNKWREGHSNVKPDFSGANLVGVALLGVNLVSADFQNANLSNAYLTGAHLMNADFTDAILRNGDLRNADLQDVCLHNADLCAANFGGANLSRANLSSTNLQYTCLIGANLTRANLSAANLFGARLSFADLGNVRSVTIEQLSEVETLYKAELESELAEQMEDNYPHLLEISKQIGSRAGR